MPASIVDPTDREKQIALTFGTLEFDRRLGTFTRDEFLRAAIFWCDNQESFGRLAWGIHAGAEYLRTTRSGFPEYIKSLLVDLASGILAEEDAQKLTAILAESSKPRPPKPPRPPRKTIIYLMRNDRTGLIKIGHSRNPSAREETLQSQEPEVTLFWTHEGTTDDELRLHEEFAANRVRGEWFSLTPSQIEAIQGYF